MPFAKEQRSKSFFSRYQVKFRRRREGKTDYGQRRGLVIQAKNKYNTARHRLVVRFTNKYVICQVVYSTIEGDRVLTAAYSSELPRYGLKAGLKNYAAAYCTGLLVARRLLKKLGMDEMYAGAEEVTGEIPSVEDEGRTFYVESLEERRPFRCVLDVGVRPTTRGARLFGALKGASDGGLDIPHSEKRFPGYDAESKSYDAGVHRDRIFGGHIRDHMSELRGEDADAYEKHFATYVKNGVGADDLEDLYENVHKAIRADPEAKPAAKRAEHDLRFKNPKRRSLAQRQDRVRQIKAAHARAVAQGRA
jgi:large subunit ribosomal protein L5e